MRQGIWVVSASVFLGVVFLFFLLVRGAGSGQRVDASQAPYERALGRPDARSWSSGMRARELAFARRLPLRTASKAPVWRSHGPSNVGGRTRALAIDVTDEDVLLAGGVTGGLWRSEDAGASWARVTGVDQRPGVTAVVQDLRPDKTQGWYYGTGEAYSGDLSGKGIYKSIDGGRTWAHLTSTAPVHPQGLGGFNYVWKLALDPSNLAQDEVYAATTGALYRSVDGGNTWEQVFDTTLPTDEPFPAAFPTDVAVTSNGAVYFTAGRLDGEVGEAHGLWRSPDGVIWTEITPPSWPQQFARTVLHVDPTDENVVYFLAHTQDLDIFSDACALWRYTYRAGDGTGGGGTWEDLSANLPANLESQGGYDLVVSVKPDDPDVVYVGGVLLFRSMDGFASAANTQNLITGPRETRTHVDQHAVVFRPSDPDVVYAANDGGVYRSTHDQAGQGIWATLNDGYVTTQFYTVALDHGTPGSYDMLGGTQDNGTLLTRSPDPGAPWLEMLGGDGQTAAISDGGVFFYVTSSGSEAITRYQADAAGNRIFSARLQPAGVERYLRSFVLDPNDTNVMYMAALKLDADAVSTLLVRHDDLAAVPMGTTAPTTAHWTELERTKILPGIRALAMSTEAPAHRLYYGLLSPHVSGQPTRPQGRLFRLDDAHADDPLPVEITGVDFPKETIAEIAVDPRDGDKVLVVFPGHQQPSLFYSADAGQRWTDVGGNLEAHPDGAGDGPSMQTVDILPLSGGETLYLAGGTTGLFSTTQLEGSATRWVREAPQEIGHSWIHAIDARASDGFVAVATYGDGVFTTHIDAASVAVEEELPIPRAFALEANYPNPFNTKTTVPFALSEPGPVTLTIHDVQGRQVATLVSREYPAGRYTVEWDATPFASGLYLYQLRTRAGAQARALTIIK